MELTEKPTRYSEKSALQKTVAIERRARRLPLVVVCAYNESESLPRLLERLAGHEVLVVDDGSTDHTGTIAKGYGARVIRHQDRQGKAAALAVAMTYAIKRG